jgi:septum formation protein
MSETPVCLASASEVRARLLRDAGVEFDIIPANIDETVTKDGYRNGDGHGSLATLLAEQKALHVSKQRPHALVLGADQTLNCDGCSFDKPTSMEAARETLLLLRGRRHTLTAAVCVVRGDQVLWRHQAQAVLEMREFSDPFLERYLARAGDMVLSSVGAYRLEDIGAQLFSAVEGDYFTVLGLPLIPVLDFLRSEGVLVT